MLQKLFPKELHIHINVYYNCKVIIMYKYFCEYEHRYRFIIDEDKTHKQLYYALTYFGKFNKLQIARILLYKKIGMLMNINHKCNFLCFVYK